MLLYTLRGQYEAITSEPEVVFSKQDHFREIWKKVEVFTSFGEICSTKMAFFAPRHGMTPHEGFCYSTCWLMWV